MKSRALATIWMLSLLAVASSGPRAAEEKGQPTNPQPARPHRRRLPDKTYDLSSGSLAGERVRGPRRIVAINLNTLRYDYSLGRVTTFAGPTDLWSKLLSATASAQQPAPSGVDTSGPAKLLAPQTVEDFKRKCMDREQKDHKVPGPRMGIYCQAEALSEFIRQKKEEMNDYAKEVNSYRDMLSGLLDKVQKETGRLALAGRSLKEALQANPPAPEGVLEEIDGLLRESPESSFLIGTKAQWVGSQEVNNLRKSADELRTVFQNEASTLPTFISDQSGALSTATDKLKAEVADLKKEPGQVELAQLFEIKLQNLGDDKGNLVLTNKLLEWVTKENESIRAAMPDLVEGSVKHTAFIEARDKLLDWKARMERIKARWTEYQKEVGKGTNPGASTNPFSVEAEGDCEFSFGGTKATSVTLTRVDQSPGNSTVPEQVLSVTIECSSPFTVSAGVGFSTVRQQEFAIRQAASSSGGTTTETFVTVAKADVHPVPIGILHARFYEPNEVVALHASLGLAGNFRSQSAGGSDAEFLLGVSLSLFRTMFITPGIYLGRRVDLSSGFSENSVVPAGMTEPPLRKSYQARFGLAITFTKP